VGITLCVFLRRTGFHVNKYVAMAFDCMGPVGTCRGLEYGGRTGTVV
jgi:hypothetical protein